MRQGERPSRTCERASVALLQRGRSLTPLCLQTGLACHGRRQSGRVRVLPVKLLSLRSLSRRLSGLAAGRTVQAAPRAQGPPSARLPARLAQGVGRRRARRSSAAGSAANAVSRVHWCPSASFCALSLPSEASSLNAARNGTRCSSFSPSQIWCNSTGLSFVRW